MYPISVAHNNSLHCSTVSEIQAKSLTEQFMDEVDVIS